MAYLPSEKVTIAVAVTFPPEGIESEGGYTNRADHPFRSVGALVTPQNPPPNLPG